MKIFEFDYVKKYGEESKRKAMLISASDDWVEVIDFTKLSPEEQSKIQEIQLEYENNMQPFIKKAFRRFNRSNMVDR